MYLIVLTMILNQKCIQVYSTFVFVKNLLMREVSWFSGELNADASAKCSEKYYFFGKCFEWIYIRT